MISRWRSLTLFTLVLAPGLLSAQQPLPSEAQQPAQQPQNKSILVTPLAMRPQQPGYIQMYEDIEVMRRILDRKLQPLYPRVNDPNITSNPSPYQYDPQTNFLLLVAPNKEEILSSLEGVYLEGRGVVYTATLVSLQPPAKAEADSPREWRVEAVLRDSEWDSIRRQVRNEKEKPKKPEWSKPSSLSDVLLKVLAENGHHFSQLPENESLTIVLTVHETNAPPPHRKSSGGSGGSAKSGSQFKSNSAIERQFEVNDLELLGELHQKQGHYEAALKAFGKAASREPGPGAEEARRLYRKMAQCYLALGNDDDARKMLNSFSSPQKETADAKDKSTPAVKPAAALPVKLIISAPKKLLDQVKEGKITFEEFRRQVNAETQWIGDRR